MKDEKPWLLEPNYLKWIDQATGYHCCIKRNALGALCGYVRIPLKHPLHGKTYHVGKLGRCNVHGGITYSEKGLRRYTGGTLRGYWVGFDCAHHFDLVPELAKMGGGLSRGGVYRDIHYVQDQVTSLAAHLRFWSKHA